MASQSRNPEGVKTVFEIGLRIAILCCLLGWCLIMLSPFFSLIIWGMIIAVASFPVYDSLKKKLKGRGAWAATFITLGFLLVLILPTIMLGESLVDGMVSLRQIYQSGEFVIPAPDSRVDSWPAFAKPVADLWTLASTNLQAAVMQFEPEIKKGMGWLVSFLAGMGVGVLQLVGSIIIAGIFLNYADQGAVIVRKIFVRLAGDKGHHFTDLSIATIRNVVKGILGVAIIQSLLAGLGIFIAGVPAAGLWTLFCLIFAIMQVGVGPIMVPMVIYLFYAGDMLTAWVFLVWALFVMLSDNFLKPILLGRGAPVPMLVVFLGSLGGFIASGFLGLFLGPVILSLGYTLYQIWVEEEVVEPEAADTSK